MLDNKTYLFSQLHSLRFKIKFYHQTYIKTIRLQYIFCWNEQPIFLIYFPILLYLYISFLFIVIFGRNKTECKFEAVIKPYLPPFRSIAEFPRYIANCKFHFPIARSYLRRNTLAQVLGRVRDRSAMSSNRPYGGIHANKSASTRPRRISALETSVLLPHAACRYSLLVERKRSILVNQTDTARLVATFLKLRARNENNLTRFG